MASRLKSIDILRALAASAVVLFHSSEAFYLGAAGVDLFFVISGFVISSIVIERPGPQFLADRALRILPLYWLALVPWALAAFFAGRLDLQALVVDALLFPRWFVTIDPLLSLSWTLVFELLFYVAAAISVRLKSCTPLLAIFALMMAAWAVTGSAQLMWFGNPLIAEFLMGVLIYRAPKIARLGMPLVVAGGLLLLCSLPLTFDIASFSSALLRTLLWGIPAAMIVYGLLSIEHRLNSPFVDRLCWLGVASYSIYLFHPLATALIAEPWWARFLLGIATGAVAWVLLEQNLERLRKSMRRRGPGRPADRPSAELAEEASA